MGEEVSASRGIAMGISAPEKDIVVEAACIDSEGS